MDNGKLIASATRAEACKHCGGTVQTHTYEVAAWGDAKPRHSIDKCTNPTCTSHMIWGGP